MSVPLVDGLKFGLMSVLSKPSVVRATVALAEECGLDSLWAGDHIAFTGPIPDALTGLTYASALSDTLTFGTSVFLAPLRHPGPLAKQIATLDRFAGGRFILGLGVGGEFPIEFALAGVPVEERGGRLSETIEVLKLLWSAEPVSYEGKYFSFPEVKMEPPPAQPGGPPIWCGGRQKAALRRAGRLADGYISYVVTPEMFANALSEVAAGAEAAGRELESFGSGHLLFAWIEDDYETALDVATAHLSKRYAMDFRKAAGRYAALGSPADVAARIDAFRAAGVRQFVLDFTGRPAERDDQCRRFMADVVPLLGT